MAHRISMVCSSEPDSGTANRHHICDEMKGNQNRIEQKKNSPQWRLLGRISVRYLHKVTNTARSRRCGSAADLRSPTIALCQRVLQITYHLTFIPDYPAVCVGPAVQYQCPNLLRVGLLVPAIDLLVGCLDPPNIGVNPGVILIGLGDKDRQMAPFCWDHFHIGAISIEIIVLPIQDVTPISPVSGSSANPSSSEIWASILLNHSALLLPGP
jgi:hypothetical protein